MRMSVKNNRGFSLIELMIVVVVIGILGAIAYPSYVDYVTKSRRSDGMDALLSCQAAQEKWRVSNTTYNGNMNCTSSEGYYTITITNVSAVSYTLSADPQGVQAVDTDCDPMVLTVNAANPRGQKGDGDDLTDATCWN